MKTKSFVYSTDGRTFQFSTGLDANVDVGGYVRLETEDGFSLLGQVLDANLNGIGTNKMSLMGSGEIRSQIDGQKLIKAPATPFLSGTLSHVAPSIVSSYFSQSLGEKAGLQIGHLKRNGDEQPATLQAAGFGRHTLVCGQSGSGKTYSLGVILERLLLETDLRIAVLDPNSDYVNLDKFAGGDRLSESRNEADLAQRYKDAVARVSIHGAREEQKPLRSRFGRLPLEQQALVLDLDPIKDVHEFNVFSRVIKAMPDTEYSLTDVRLKADALSEDGAKRLSMRIENLNVEDLQIWAPDGEPAMLDLIPKDWRGIVLDLGSLPSSNERSMMAASAVSAFWQSRHNRQPTLLVIDEAHNVCPQTPTDRFQAMAAEELPAIAGEGRKFGLYLLLVTQRPQKLHVNVLSQCENILLMRMNSTSDIDHLASVFSHVPASLVEQASTFGLGEGLAAGRIAADPMLFKTGARYSKEGGSDIPSTWADKK